MPIGPNRSATAGRSYCWSAVNCLRLCNFTVLASVAQISTALRVVVGLIISTVTAAAHVHAPAEHQAITGAVGHGDAHSDPVQRRRDENPSGSPLTCSAWNQARVFVSVLQHQQQSSESFRTAGVGASRLPIRTRNLRPITSGTRLSLKTTTEFSSLPPPGRNL